MKENMESETQKKQEASIEYYLQYVNVSLIM